MDILKKLFLICVVVILCCAFRSSEAETSNYNISREYQIKATYLLHFGRFVTWPPNGSTKEDPFVFGVLGEDPFGDQINGLASKEILGRKVIIKRFKKIDEIKDCHILFIGSSEQSRLSQVLKRVGEFKILTVGEMWNFTRHGGMIQFTNRRNKIRLIINLEAVKKKGLTIDSRLLNVAKVVGR